MSRNKLGQTLLTLVEVNRESLPESLALLLKREYGCHQRDMDNTELCLSKQLESAICAEKILEQLHQLEPKSNCELISIWVMLFLTSLVPNLTLGTMDIFSDAYLSKQYYDEWQSKTYAKNVSDICNELKLNASEANEFPELKAFAACLNSESKFFYTIIFLVLVNFFYLIEFMVLDTKYEPTGLRKKIVVSIHLQDDRGIEKCENMV